MEHRNTATWIWYPGDFERYLHEKVSLRREERGRVYPPFWEMAAPSHVVTFRKRFELKKPEKVSLWAEGDYFAVLDHWAGIIYQDLVEYDIPEGKHELKITTANPTGLPAIYMEGETLVTGDSWEASLNGRHWVRIGRWNFDSPEKLPSQYRLETEERMPHSLEEGSSTLLVDFGLETFGYVHLHQISGRGDVMLCYGESREEALSVDHCETFDRISVDGEVESEVTLDHSRAYRFVYIVMDKEVRIGKVDMLYEYLPVEYRGKFQSSDPLLNKIWETSVYTLHLNTREFLLDGIKRDRWVWMGDAYQGEIMDYYTFFDTDVVKRTLTAVRGKDPADLHINQIMDYTFYWFMALYDHYLYTGDKDYIIEQYDRMVSLMDFCLGRTNEEGLMEGREDDWVYLDWADIDNRGEVSTEQILFARSLEIMGEFAAMMGDTAQAERYVRLHDSVREKITEIFWDEERQVFTHSRADGKLTEKITRYPNMFAVLLKYVDKEKEEMIRDKVLMNPEIQAITTPYMRFYELGALCQLGEHEYVLKEMRSYWGGMLDLGATTFWEKYNPEEQGLEHYAMYDRPFGKSLCHAWGASPVYLLGKYYLGVKPLTPGYETYCIEPCLGDLEWMEGSVPTPDGSIEVYMDRETIRVTGVGQKGYLRFPSSVVPEISEGKIIQIGEDWYEVLLEKPHQEYVVKYIVDRGTVPLSTNSD